RFRGVNFHFPARNFHFKIEEWRSNAGHFQISKISKKKCNPISEKKNARGFFFEIVPAKNPHTHFFSRDRVNEFFWEFWELPLCELINAHKKPRHNAPELNFHEFPTVKRKWKFWGVFWKFWKYVLL
ncbi:MAG: hypothetical protein IJP68_01665, partial [Selenomonadaceae bacterium]|nr:hypothetical protein [Selenomonadaceae bacterium]